MKNSRNNTTHQSKQGISKKPRPEIRDNMDSRQNKEIGHSSKQMSKKGDLKKNEN